MLKLVPFQHEEWQGKKKFSVLGREAIRFMGFGFGIPPEQDEGGGRHTKEPTSKSKDQQQQR